jgi:hypothetical protein
MTQKSPSSAASRKKTETSDVEPTYPAGQERATPDDTEYKRSQEQAGQDLRDPENEADDDD